MSGRRWTEASGYRRDHLRTPAQRVEVDTKEVRTLVAASRAMCRDGAPRPMKMALLVRRGAVI